MDSRESIMKYSAFLSYATEDKTDANKINQFCQSYGFNIWYAPLSLEPGQKLLQSIDDGLKYSEFGILLLTKAYIMKNWPKYEFDTLMRQNIEMGKIIIPIWLNIKKQEIETLSVGLSGIVGIDTTNIDDAVLKKVLKVLSKNAPTIGIIPTYQDPVHQFLVGRGEIKIGNPDGPATSLWEIVLNFTDEMYPISINGKLITQEEIYFHASNSISFIPDIVEGFTSKSGRIEIIRILKSKGISIIE
jgi:hypothetical protein